MTKGTLYISFIALVFQSCIGDDLIFDSVAESLRITIAPDTLAVGDEFPLEYQYTNEVGLEESVTVQWISSDPTILSVSEDGVVIGLSPGEASIILSRPENTLSDTTHIIVGETTVLSSTSRSGQLQTTSSYVLEGDFELADSGNGLTLSLGSNYRASSSLPGLYVYLTNNPNTINGAVEISKVTVFSGAHSFTVPSEVDIEEYSYVLYYCKPFSVKVGDGQFDN